MTLTVKIKLIVRNYMVLILLLVSPLLFAQELQIEGTWRQGELLKGKVPAGTKVIIFDHDVHVSKSGNFIFGLGRNASEHVVIAAQFPSGEKRDYRFSVEQREYNIQYIEGVKKDHVSPPKALTKRIKAEAGQVWLARQNKYSDDYFSGGFLWPLLGPITGVYGSQRFYNGVPKNPHYGLDIAATEGTLVNAPAPGLVTLVHDDMFYSGGTLILDHGQGLSSTFIHLSKILVEKGDYVKQGQGIAEVGATGRATGPHLDWRINWLNQRLDPFPLLPPKPKKVSN